MNPDHLAAVYAANDSYARHLGVSLCSLLRSNRDFGRLTVYILSSGISQANRRRLSRIARAFGRKICWIEAGGVQARLSFDADTGGYDISIALRLFMGSLLPAGLDRVLYLDCDTVVARSLRQLWCTPLSGNVLGAVMEPTIYPEVKRSIGLLPGAPYYNSGVLLVDLTLWRKYRTEERLLSLWKKKNGKLFASDQDLLNGVLAGRIRSLAPQWNFFTNYRYFSYGTLVRHEPAYRAVSRAEFACARRHPAIIHYMGDERPWIAGSLNHYRRAYEKTLAKTPFAGAKKTEGKRLFMLAYHAMNWLTVLCPPLRWRISRRLGMRFTERRRKNQDDLLKQS